MTSTTPPIQETTSTLVVVAGDVEITPLAASVDGQVLATNVPYLDSTNPLIVNSGQHELVLSNGNGPQLSQSITIGPSSQQLKRNHIRTGAASTSNNSLTG
jgi:hypothetical protein